MTQATAERKQPDQRSLWFGMLTGPIVYSLHFVTVYLRGDLVNRFTGDLFGRV
jgi:hypothetical protein